MRRWGVIDRVIWHSFYLLCFPCFHTSDLCISLLAGVGDVVAGLGDVEQVLVVIKVVGAIGGGRDQVI